MIAKKNRINSIARGVFLAEAANLDGETAIFWLDARQDDGKDRYVALGYIAARLYCVVYTNRTDARRIINLRKANLREERRDAQTQTWSH
ncbi:BrnT family toxin [Bordetella sp. FB-8]|uniref:BrnT family toxin n=1 Tax=Bordetella sp. FB-8 TaxID=1159870 RepID=UPI000379AD0F|nr:BrnT family toxin [Bordetella sp. FB-8]